MFYRSITPPKPILFFRVPLLGPHKNIISGGFPGSHLAEDVLGTPRSKQKARVFSIGSQQINAVLANENRSDPKVSISFGLLTLAQLPSVSFWNGFHQSNRTGVGGGYAERIRCSQADFRFRRSMRGNPALCCCSDAVISFLVSIQQRKGPRYSMGAGCMMEESRLVDLRVNRLHLCR